MIISLLKMELYKFFHRKSCLFLLFFPLLPIFYGLGKILNWSSVVIEGDISAVNFASMCWLLLGYTGITNIIFVILIANSFSVELRDGQLRLFKLRCNNISEIFDAKCISIAIQIIISYLLLYIMAIIIYYTCIANNLNKITIINSFNDLSSCIISDFIVTEQLLLICGIELLACRMFSSSSSIFIGILASLSPLIISSIPVIKYIDPEEILDQFNNSQISGYQIFIYGCLYIAIILSLTLYSRKKFLKVDVC
ncbi:hypothetical protein SAMN05216390_10475 [Lachnospiraceae bacterium KH1T2]|nr:hypothetical protein SAMN05216390_10475 [Lachnospiraceae bacterium KH1T2]